jgi:hypothetical protein
MFPCRPWVCQWFSGCLVRPPGRRGRRPPAAVAASRAARRRRYGRARPRPERGRGQSDPRRTAPLPPARAKRRDQGRGLWHRHRAIGLVQPIVGGGEQRAPPPPALRPVIIPRTAGAACAGSGPAARPAPPTFAPLSCNRDILDDPGELYSRRRRRNQVRAQLSAASWSAWGKHAGDSIPPARIPSLLDDSGGVARSGGRG